MWIQFAPQAVRWLLLGSVVVLGLLLLLMPAEERARLFREIRRRGARPRPPSIAHEREFLSEGDDARFVGHGTELPREQRPQFRDVGRLAVAARVAIVASAVVVLVLLLWMVLVFLSNLPGWS